MKSDLAKLDEVFAPSGFPSVKGKKWVVVGRGPSLPAELNQRPFDTEGWLVEDGPRGVVLLDWSGTTHRLRRPHAHERRPELKPNKDGGVSWDSMNPPDRSVAWAVGEVDYAAKCKRFLADGVPKGSGDRGVYGGVSDRFRHAGYVVDSARQAHFASQQGRAELAAEFHAYGLKVYKEYEATYLGGPDPSRSFTAFVVDRIATDLRNDAVASAHALAPRKELLAMWVRLAAMPDHIHRAEAKAMVKQYERLLAEDARWVEPDAKALAKLTTDQKVEYWLYHLRDLSVGQSEDPGTCRVLKDLGGVAGEGPKLPNPAVELKKLGKAALPRLIAQLDDERPTRCKGHWRSYWPDDHYLLSYGDCCRQIFEAITGHRVTDEQYPIRDGKGKECKEAAEKWWQENQAKLAEGNFDPK